MSTGFPHDPFHQIVNVKWGDRLVFRLSLRLLRELSPLAGSCSPTTVESFSNPTAVYTTSVTWDFSDVVAEARRWINQEWDDPLDVSDFSMSGLPTLPTITFADWSVLVAFVQAGDVLVGFDADVGAPLTYPVPDSSPEVFFVNSTTSRAHGRGTLITAGPTCVGAPLGGSGSLRGNLDTSQTQLSETAITPNFASVRLTDDDGKKWRPTGIKTVTSAVPFSVIDLWFLCERAPT